VLLCYCVIVLLCYCVIVLLCYCVIVLLCYCVIVLYVVWRMSYCLLTFFSYAICHTLPLYMSFNANLIPYYCLLMLLGEMRKHCLSCLPQSASGMGNGVGGVGGSRRGQLVDVKQPKFSRRRTDMRDLSSVVNGVAEMVVSTISILKYLFKPI
jgi:hypothetical protein